MSSTPSSEISKRSVSPGQVAHPRAWGPDWYRNPFTQTVIVGLCAFCAPGIWSAISATGAGGTLEANLVNGVNAFSLVLTATFCLIGPWVVNIVGFRWGLVIATYGYPLYSAGLYYHQVSDKTWLMWFGTLLCGTSGGIFWAVEPAIVLGYSTPETRGRHMGIWITLNNIGTLVAGAINLGFNAKTAVKGSLSDITYLVLIGIACTGPLFALLLSNPHQVRRSNGTPVEYTKTPINLLTEFKAMFHLAKQPTILLLLPLSFYVWFQQTYTTTYLALHFTIRARALASFVLGITCMTFAALSGLWLDYKGISLRWRARGLFLFIVTLGTISWIWAIALQASFDRGAITETLDWTSRLYVAGILPYLFHNALGFGVLTGFLPWVIAELTESHDDFIRAAAFARAVTGYGATISFALGAAPKLPPVALAGITFGLLVLAIPGGALAIWKIDNGPKPIQPQVSAEKATSHALAAVIGGPVTGGIPVHADVEKRA